MARIYHDEADERGDRGLSEYDLWWCRLGDATDLGYECQRSNVGTIILLDADGKEIA